MSSTVASSSSSGPPPSPAPPSPPSIFRFDPLSSRTDDIYSSLTATLEEVTEEKTDGASVAAAAREVPIQNKYTAADAVSRHAASADEQRQSANVKGERNKQQDDMNEDDLVVIGKDGSDDDEKTEGDDDDDGAIASSAPPTQSSASSALSQPLCSFTPPKLMWHRRPPFPASCGRRRRGNAGDSRHGQQTSCCFL
jgi:hypothetical protein